MLLATDLDGTFLGGELHHRQRLYKLVKNNPFINLVFVTGRGLESIVPLFNDPLIPRPDYIICDVGATVVDGHTYNSVEPIQGAIKKGWPGTFTILRHFKNIEWLEYQQVPQQRRCSFFLRDAALLPQVKAMADEINCDILYSAGKFLDVLPKAINKGSSLSKLVSHLSIQAEDVLVAGDSMNDLDMYVCGFKSVAVGGSENALLKSTADLRHTYHATASGAGGILEAMFHFERFKHFVRSPLYIA